MSTKQNKSGGKTDVTEFEETADVETSSDEYAERFSGRVGRWFLEVQERATLDMLAPYPGATVLDVGGGHGQTAEALVENGYDLTILGSAPSCRSRISSLADADLCRFEVGDILDLPFGAESFDVVISYRLLPHVTNWKVYLSELARVARKAVVIDYPEVQSFNYIAPMLFPFKKQMEGDTRPYRCFRMEDIVQALDGEGFIHSDHYRQFFLPMVLHRQVNTVKLSSMLETVSRKLGLTQRLGSPVILKLTRTS